MVAITTSTSTTGDYNYYVGAQAPVQWEVTHTNGEVDRINALEDQIRELNNKYERLIRAIESRGLRLDFEF